MVVLWWVQKIQTFVCWSLMLGQKYLAFKICQHTLNYSSTALIFCLCLSKMADGYHDSTPFSNDVMDRFFSKVVLFDVVRLLGWGKGYKVCSCTTICMPHIIA